MATSGKRRKAKQVARGIKKHPKTYTKKMTAAELGPVTLDEAKALAQAKHPKLAMRAARKGAAPPASPAPVGAERERLEQERRAEFTRRIQEYKATMEIMKKRGARRPRSKRAHAPKRGKPAHRERSVCAATDFRRGRFMVRLPHSLLWGRDYSAPRKPARCSDLESCKSG
jgi:hypothetical protein